MLIRRSFHRFIQRLIMSLNNQSVTSVQQLGRLWADLERFILARPAESFQVLLLYPRGFANIEKLPRLSELAPKSVSLLLPKISL